MELKGAEFLLEAVNRPSMIEDMTGLTKLKRDAEAAMELAEKEMLEDEDDELL